MNRYLIEAIVDMAKAKAVADALDELYMDHMEDKHQSLFLALYDELDKVQADLERLTEDLRVVDAIYAAGQVRTKTSILDAEA